MRVSLLALVLALGACKDKGGDSAAPADNPGPTLTYAPAAGSLTEGGSLDVSVLAEDEDGVAAVVMYYRTLGEEFWDDLPLTPDGAVSSTAWSGTLEGVEAPGVEYYFKAEDMAEPAAVSYDPAGGSGAPYQASVLPDGIEAPYLEDFEPAETEDSLLDLGWWTPSDGVNAYAFQLTSSESASGSYSACHPRGYDETALSDWIISPALDLSGLETAMVGWQEYGADTDEIGAHGLYVSTGSRLPEDGDFVALNAALPAPPDGEWGAAEWVDLSEWAGEPVVYLAWRYEGADGDDWCLDDVAVRELAPVLEASLEWSPNPASPGEDVTLTVTLQNTTAAAAEGVTATLSLPEGGGALAADTVSVPSIEGFGAEEAVFTLTLDEATAANRYLPLRLELAYGEDESEHDLTLLVGRPSFASVDLTVDADTYASVTIGVGDLEAPLWSASAHAGTLTAGTHALSVEITDQYDLLPPAPGRRWFAVVESGASGSVSAFTLNYGEDVYAADDPASFSADIPATVWVPTPPEPALLSASPAEAAPGDVVSLTLDLTNVGAATAGPVTATLVSADPDATVLDPDPFLLDPDAWEAGEDHSLSGLDVAISPDHDDSTPVRLSLELTDGIESWSVPVAVEVPWPVLKIVGVIIDDSGGDGILDPGETAELEIAVANSGGLATFGSVEASLALAGTSTAAADVADDSPSYGTLSVGEDGEEDGYTLSVTSGAAGDALDLVLTLSDDDAVYTDTLQLILGEPPWLSLSPIDDPVGDALGGSDLDLLNARHRVVGDTVELLVLAAAPFDASVAFIEAWGYSSGADYDYYRLVLQSGVASLQGYTDSAGFLTIGAVDVAFPDASSVLLSWSLADMALDEDADSFDIGLAAGWCGPDSYYCDHFPDGWGYPYVSFDPYSWYTVSW